MTREQAKELLPIITAYAEGKEVQILKRLTNKWVDCPRPLFESVVGEPAFRNYQYRIKPKMREFWLVKHKSLHQSEGWNQWTTNPLADYHLNMAGLANYNILHIVEVEENKFQIQND